MNTEKLDCFVISQFGEEGSVQRKHADMVLRYIIRVGLPDYNVVRADEISNPDNINKNMIDAIHRMDLVVADLTDRNPNVFYELGVRHTLRKPTIHIAHLGTVLPFDNHGVKTIFYDVQSVDSHTATSELIAKAAAATRKKGYKASNPITAALGELALDKSADDKDRVIAELAERMSAIEARLAAKTEPNVIHVGGRSLFPNTRVFYGGAKPSDTLIGGIKLPDTFYYSTERPGDDEKDD